MRDSTAGSPRRETLESHRQTETFCEEHSARQSETMP
jgi:hypothetical protein